MSDTTVLVTGGSGFLGSWTIATLLRQGYGVRTTVRDRGREAELRAALGDVNGGLTVVEADLGQDAGWEAAAKGCRYVLHVASPFPAAQPRDPETLIGPARDGTLRVLRAGLWAGARRVVVTSSSSAVRGGRPAGRPLTEDDWTDPQDSRLTPYVRSKTLAERAAWEFAEDAGACDRLTVINPATILGPALTAHRSYSLSVIERMLAGAPGLPRLGFSFVDVRDVAAMHVAAMTAPEAAGERILAAGPFLWFAELAELLRELGPAAAKVPTRTLPDWLVRLRARFDPGLRSVVGELGQRTDYSTEKARELVGWNPRSIEQTVRDTALSLIGTA
jgi:dihydroflavonol-4-reductase